MTAQPARPTSPAGNQIITDQGGEVRASENLDVTQVDRWLRTQTAGLAPAFPRVTQYAGGASNWTYRLQYENRDLVLRRPPAGTKAKSSHDMGREFRVQSALKPVFPQVPHMVGLCTDESVLGCEFYVMDRVDGIIPRRHFPRGVTLTPEQARRLCLNFIDTLVALHKVDARTPGLDSLGKGTGYAQRQVDGWNDRYEQALTWNVLAFRDVRDWLQANVPADCATCLIHNDWRLDNVVLAVDDPTRIIGVLDWEMATLGDPLMDLGNALAYWIQDDDSRILKLLARQPSLLPGMLTRQELVDYYLQETGLRPANWAFYEVYGLFRVAAIAQQIYYRYHHKQTRNPAFRNFWLMANFLGLRCRRIIRGAR